MAVAALHKQHLYAKLLQHHGYGYPIYNPTRVISVGDVGCFVGTDYSCFFNVFNLDDEMAERIGIERFEGMDGMESPENVNIPGIASVNIRLNAGTVDVNARNENSAGFTISIEKTKTSQAAAVCLLAAPVMSNRAASSYDLALWWEKWRHGIAAYYRRINTTSSAFLVCGTRTSPQFVNCCTNTLETSSKLQVSGSGPVILDSGISFTAGCAIQEVNKSFGFQIGAYQRNENAWVVFMNKLPSSFWGPMRRLKSWFLWIINKSGRVNYKGTKASRSTHNHHTPASLTANGDSNGSRNTANILLQNAKIFQLSEEWNILLTMEHEIFVEYTGPSMLDLPKNLNGKRAKSRVTEETVEEFILKQITPLVQRFEGKGRLIEIALLENSVILGPSSPGEPECEIS